jgi:hypothetical protein
MANRLGVYLDESATDGGTPVAVVGGLLLDWCRYAWFDIEWGKALASAGMTAVHMRHIGKKGYLKGVSLPEKRAVFEKLVSIVNEHKDWSIAAKLSAEDYKRHFSWLEEQGLGLYATCFLLTAVQQGKQLDSEKYPYALSYLMDDGNPYKDQLIEVHGYMKTKFENAAACRCGALDFGDDEKIRPLQAADVISWTVRRRATGMPFRKEFEPLEGITVPKHLELEFKAEWMAEISDALRAKQALRETGEE